MLQPKPLEFSIGIVHLRLPFGIEGPIPGVVSNAAIVHPVAPIAVYIVIDEHCFKIGGTDTPVLLQVFGPVAGHVLSATVAHPSRFLQLYYLGVDKIIIRLPVDPIMLGSFVVVPLIIVSKDTINFKDLVPML